MKQDRVRLRIKSRHLRQFLILIPWFGLIGSGLLLGSWIDEQRAESSRSYVHAMRDVELQIHVDETHLSFVGSELYHEIVKTNPDSIYVLGLAARIIQLRNHILSIALARLPGTDRPSLYASFDAENARARRLLYEENYDSLLALVDLKTVEYEYSVAPLQDASRSAYLNITREAEGTITSYTKNYILGGILIAVQAILEAWRKASEKRRA